MFKKPDKYPHSLPPSTPLATTEGTSATQWLLPPSSSMRVPASSFLITSTVFVVFILDMASPGYGSFALIPNARPYIATLTTDIRSDLRKLMRSEPSLPVEIQTNEQPFNCRKLLDAYHKDAECHFKPKNY